MTSHDNMPLWFNDQPARLKRKNAFDGSLAIGTARFNKETGRLKTTSQPFLWAVDNETNLLRSDLTQPRLCPSCGVFKARELFIKDGFRHVACCACELVYVNNILQPGVVEKYWREESAWTEVLNSGPQVQLDRLKYLYGLDLLTPRLKGRRLLDIGSGPGGFVRIAAEAGWEPTALELNQQSNKKLKDDGYKVIDTELEKSTLAPKSFDLIALWEVLEHLADPKSVMAYASRLLADGGLFLILVPNAGSLVSRLLHEKSNTFGGHSHLNHFSPQTLTSFLSRLGLKIIEMETVITELGTINNHLAFEDPYNGEAGSFWEGLTPRLIHENLWGSRLLAVAGLN